MTSKFVTIQIQCLLDYGTGLGEKRKYEKAVSPPSIYTAAGISLPKNHITNRS